MNNIKILRWVLLTVIVIAVAAIVFMAVGTKKKQIVIKTDIPQAIVTSVTKSGPSVEMKNVSYSTTSNDNVKEWDLTADSAQYLQGEKRVLLENPFVNVYRPDGKVFKIRGRNGDFNTETRNIKLRGAVWGAMPDNTTIETESIDYDHQKRFITTQDKIVIHRSSKFALEGKGMIIDMDKEKMSILSNVKALGSK
jgi:LPS export ABC transporter protein LptC